MAPHSSTLAWKIPWTEEPGRLQSMGSLKVWTWLSNFTSFHFHALEKEMATHSSVLAWRIPGTGEPGVLPSMGSHRVGHDWSDLAAAAAAAGSLLRKDEEWEVGTAFLDFWLEIWSFNQTLFRRVTFISHVVFYFYVTCPFWVRGLVLVCGR